MCMSAVRVPLPPQRQQLANNFFRKLLGLIKVAYYMSLFPREAHKMKRPLLTPPPHSPSRKIELPWEQTEKNVWCVAGRYAQGCENTDLWGGCRGASAFQTDNQSLQTPGCVTGPSLFGKSRAKGVARKLWEMGGTDFPQKVGNLEASLLHHSSRWLFSPIPLACLHSLYQWYLQHYCEAAQQPLLIF